MKVEADSEIRVRARLYRVTDNGNLCFMKLRESYETIQCVVDKKALSKGMFDFAKKISHESIVEVVAKIVNPAAPVTGTTIQGFELHAQEVWCVNRSVPVLPFQIMDAMTVCEDQEAEMKGGEKAEEGEEEKKEGGNKKTLVVNQKVRLDNRVIDLRVPTNQAIMRL